MRVFKLVLPIWLLLTGGLAWAESPDLASALVRDETDKMLQALESNKPKLEQEPALIYNLVGNILVPAFDFPGITRFAMGREWRKASSEQRERLTEEFQQMLVRTYATALLNYSGQEIRYLPLRPGSRPGQITVRTEVSEPGAVTIPIDYKLHVKEGAWKVYDVVIDNISLVSNYRSSFAAQIRRGGVDGLIKALRARNKGVSK